MSTDNKPKRRQVFAIMAARIPPEDLSDPRDVIAPPKQPQGRSRGKGKYRKPWEM